MEEQEDYRTSSRIESKEDNIDLFRDQALQIVNNTKQSISYTRKRLIKQLDDAIIFIMKEDINFLCSLRELAYVNGKANTHNSNINNRDGSVKYALDIGKELFNSLLINDLDFKIKPLIEQIFYLYGFKVNVYNNGFYGKKTKGCSESLFIIDIKPITTSSRIRKFIFNMRRFFTV